ncbi:MAG: PIN domain-containing protein [Gemmatimonadetes bacterium]|nr:PIN domain-containing protein [Gemmatimonadota bacterium]
MCAIVDANVVSEVFGSNLPPAGEKFFDWLNKGSGQLIVGGKLLEELEKSSAEFRRWGQEAQLAGKMRIVNRSEVDARTEQIQSAAAIRSNDPHVIALAQVSGARLLYSNDGNLQQDFKNKSLIDDPRGKVYSTS